MKWICALALTVFLALSVTSCSKVNASKQEDDSQAEGHSLSERRITLNEESPKILDIRGGENEYTIVSTDANGKTLHQSTVTLTIDGKGEQSSLVEIANTKKDQTIFAAVISPEGSVLYSCASQNEGVKNYTANPGGEPKEIEVALPAIIPFAYVDQYSFIATTSQNEKLVRLDATSGEIKATYQLNNEQHFLDCVIVGEDLIVLSSEVINETMTHSATSYGRESGEKTSNLDELTSAIDSVLPKDKIGDATSAPFLSKNEETGNIYVFSKGMVYSVGTDNSVSLWASGENTNLLNTSLLLQAVLPNDNGFVASYFDVSSFEFTLYSYSLGQRKTKDSLTVYMLEDNPEITRAAASFREKNENVEVKTQIGLPKGTKLMPEDAIRQLNLDILSGTGPDIIVLDGFSVEQFQKENLLVDISDVSDRLMTSDTNYYKNVLSCFDNESGCYAIPMRFTMPSILADKSILDQINSIEDVARIAESSKGERQSFLGFNCDLSTFYAANYKNIVQDGSVSKEELSHFFEQAKRIVDVSQETYNLNKELLPQSQINVIASALESFTDQRRYGVEGTALLKIPPDGLSVGFCSAEISTVKSVSSFPLISLAINSNDNELALGFLNFTGTQVFLPSSVLGISSSSSNIDLSKQFIEFALSNEQQKSNQRTGLPVNKIAFKEVLERYSADATGVSFGGETTYSYGPLNEREIQDYLDMIDAVEKATACNIDRVTTDLIRTGLESYLRNQMTLTEAVESTYQKYSLYILE